MVIDRTSILEYADEELVKERDAALAERDAARAALEEKDAALREMEIANAALKERETDVNIIRLAWDKEEPEAIARQLGVAVERVESVLGRPFK